MNSLIYHNIFFDLAIDKLTTQVLLNHELKKRCFFLSRTTHFSILFP